MINPTWIQTSPQDFMSAIQGGAQLGLRLATLQQQAAEEAARIKASGRMAPPRVSFGGGEAPAPAIPAPRGPGYSPDGLSYAVENDPGKMAGNAAATDEARLAYNATNANNPLVDKAANPPILSPVEIASNRNVDYTYGKKAELQKQAQDAAQKLQELRNQKPTFRTADGIVYKVDDEGNAEPITPPPVGRNGGSPEEALIKKVQGDSSTSGKPQAATSNKVPTPEGIDHLRKNPQLKAQFDALFGPGAADRYMGTSPASRMGFQF